MAAYTGTRLTSDHSPRTRTIGGWVLHHAAMTGAVEALLSLMMPGGRTVSAHGAFKDGQRIQAVPHNRRAWSLADAWWDSWALTCECVNNAGAPAWTLSAATHESIAQWIAATSRETGIRPHRDGDPRTWTVIGHREVYTIHGGSYATACPGGMDLAWITRRAQEILGSGGAPVALPPAESTEPTWGGYPIKEIQRLLTAHGFATAVDGIYGPDTRAKVRAFQASVGITVDGDVGPVTWGKLRGAPTGTPAKLDVDGVWGALTTKALQRALGVEADGIIGPVTTRALQRKLGVTADGIIGPVTRKALQRHLGVKQDGIWGPETTKALQRRLNAGTF